MTKNFTPAAAHLGPAGTALWSSVVDSYDLEEYETALLLQACRAADRLDELAVAVDGSPVVTTVKGDLAPHPAVVESRAQSLVLARLIASLRLPTGETEDGAMVRPPRRGAARGTYRVRATA